MKTLENRVTECERRLLVLEKFREKDLEEINASKLELSGAIKDLKHLTEAINGLPDKLEEAITKSIDMQKQEHAKMYESINSLKEEYKEIKEEVDNFKITLDERTIGQNSKNYDKIKSTIVTVIITAVVTAVASKFIGLLLK